MCNQTVNQEHKVLCIQFPNKCNWPIKKDYIRIITWSTLMEDDIHESVFDGRKQTMNRWNQLHDLEKRKCRWRCWLRQNGVKKFCFTFAEAEQTDEGAVGRAQGWLVLLGGEGFEVRQMGGTGGRERRLGVPVHRRGWWGSLVFSSHVTAPAGQSKPDSIQSNPIMYVWLYVYTK